MLHHAHSARRAGGLSRSAALALLAGGLATKTIRSTVSPYEQIKLLQDETLRRGLE